MGRIPNSDKSTRQLVDEFISRQKFGLVPVGFIETQSSNFQSQSIDQPKVRENAPRIEMPIEPRDNNATAMMQLEPLSHPYLIPKGLSQDSPQRLPQVIPKQPAAPPIPIKSESGEQYVTISGQKIRVLTDQEADQEARKRITQQDKLQVIVKSGCGHCNWQKKAFQGLIETKDAKGRKIFRLPNQKSLEEMSHALPRDFDKKNVEYYRFLGGVDLPVDLAQKFDIEGNQLNQLVSALNAMPVVTIDGKNVLIDKNKGIVNKDKLEQTLHEAKVTEAVMKIYNSGDGFPTFLRNPKVCDIKADHCYDKGAKGVQSVVKFVKDNDIKISEIAPLKPNMNVNQKIDQVMQSQKVRN